MPKSAAVKSVAVKTPAVKSVAKKPAAKRIAAAKRAAPVYQIKVTLEDIEPLIWRRLLVRSDIKLSKLHDLLQTAFAWEDAHMHHFFNKENQFFAPPEMTVDDFGGPPTRDTSQTCLNEVMTKLKDVLRYEYDFGDGWMHFIALEEIIDDAGGALVPACIAGENAAPPDDCGGPPGYMNLVQVLADPANQEYGELLEWVGDKFDPHHVDIHAITARLHPRARRWVPPAKS